MGLNIAIFEVIKKYGAVLVTTKQFANILDDSGSFKTEPAATKRVLKGLMDSGFGVLSYQLSQDEDKNWQNEIRKAVSDYAAKSGYKDDLVNHVATSVLFGLGIITEMPKFSSEPKPQRLSPNSSRIKDPKELLFALKQQYLTALSELMTIGEDEYGYKYGYYDSKAEAALYSLSSKLELLAKELNDLSVINWITDERDKIEKRNRPSESQIKQALDEIMINLEKDYKNMMDKGVTIVDDEFGLKLAQFKPEVTSDLHEIETRIIIIGNRRNENRKDWIAKTKSDFLTTKSSPVSARIGVLDNLKGQYKSRLAELDKSAKSGDIDFSDVELSDIRKKVINLGGLLGQNISQWCDEKNAEIHTQRHRRKKRKKIRNVILGSAAGLVMFIGGGMYLDYSSSKDEIAEYETNIAAAQNAYDSGNMPEALTLFLKAENDYDGSYNSTTYKREAHSKALEVSNNIIEDWQKAIIPLIAEGNVVKAKSLALTLPNNLVVEGEQGKAFNSKMAELDENLQVRANEMVNELLNAVYSNHGKLHPTQMQQLEEMIAVVPDNYWLNFIKEKTK